MASDELCATVDDSLFPVHINLSSIPDSGVKSVACHSYVDVTLEETLDGVAWREVLGALWSLVIQSQWFTADLEI